MLLERKSSKKSTARESVMAMLTKSGAAIVAMLCVLPYAAQYSWWIDIATVVLEALFRHPSFFIGSIPMLHSEENWGYNFEDLDKTNLTGQTALITGANSGIGLEIARALSRQGASVTLACRNPSKCQAAADKIQTENAIENVISKIEILIMDTSSLDSVKRAALSFKQSFANRSLDMLFLNAGTGTAGKNVHDGLAPLSKDGIEMVFATNVVGHHLLYRLLEDLLQSSPMARVVSTTSSGSFISYNFIVGTDLDTVNGVNPNSVRVYGHSKLAQIVWTKALTRRLEAKRSPSNIYVNAGHPGLVNTPIFEKYASKLALLPEFLHPTIIRIVNAFMKAFSWTPAEGALTVLFLGVATDSIVKKDLRGRYFHPQVQEVINPLAQDDDLQDRFWNFCDNLVIDFIEGGGE